MDIIFADDAAQAKPSREGMGRLLAIGGVHVPAGHVGPLEKAIQAHCTSIGFPGNEQFKWSPGKRETFQREELSDDRRLDFFVRNIDLALEHGAKATVVVEDVQFARARAASSSPEDDVTALFLERSDWTLRASGTSGLVVIAKPSGGSGDEAKFVASCIDTIQSGTEYVTFDTLPLGIVVAPSRQMRLLQLADVITSCSVARIGGESNYSPRVFERIRLLFRTDGTRVGGVGLKIHPDTKYANLYHWLLGDSHWWKGQTGQPLPAADLPYSNGLHDS